MKNHIEREIIKVAEEYNIELFIFDDKSSNSLFSAVSKKYSNVSTEIIPLWDNLFDAVYVVDPNGWSKISNFVGNKSCVLLILNGEKKAFKLSCGADLHELLENSFGFEFYITDENISFLICFNHHDQLVCCGKAKKWGESVARDLID